MRWDTLFDGLIPVSSAIDQQYGRTTQHIQTRAAVAASMRCECDADDGRLERFKTTTEITFEISQGHYYWCYSRGPYDFRIPLTFDV